MEISTTKNLTLEQFQQINQMWNEEYPVQLKDRFGILLEGGENYNHYLIEQNHTVLAWAVEFEKEKETRFFTKNLWDLIKAIILATLIF